MARYAKSLSLAAAIGILGVACGSQEPEAAGPAGDAPVTEEAPACEPQAEGADLQLVAPDSETGQLPKFDKTCVAAPAGQPFTIELTNADFLEHNVSIYLEEGASYSDGIFHGELFRGPDEVRVYEVDPLDAGTYYYRCDEHLSNMKGILLVR